MSSSQAATEKAIATIAVDGFIVSAFKLSDYLIANSFHHATDEQGIFWWRPEALREFRSIPNYEGLEGNAAKAFPEQAPSIVQAARAIKDAQLLADEYDANPWVNPADLQHEDPRHAAKSQESDEILNRFYRSLGQLGHIAPHVRP